jgi:hypothetical protein
MRLKNSEHLEFFEEIINLIKKFGAEALGITVEFAVLETKYAEEKKCASPKTKSNYTEKIKETDAARDVSFLGLVQYVKSYLNYFDPAKADAAQRIWNMLQPYGNVTIKGYDGETADIDNIVIESRGNYAVDVDIIEAKERVDKMATDNQTFKILVEKRYVEQTGRPDISMKKIRPEVDHAFNGVVTKVTALEFLDTTGKYIPFISELNKHIAHYKTLIKQQEAHNKAIAKNLADSNITEIAAQAYTGTHVTPLVEVFFFDKVKQKMNKLVEDKDYKLVFENNINAGTATVIIKGKGSYTGKKISTFNIVHVE